MVFIVNYGFYHSILGIIKISEQNNYIIKIEIVRAIENDAKISNEIKKCMRQLELYFQGNLKKFNLNIKYHGTKFQEQVWQRLLEIEYGSKFYYQDIAQDIGYPLAARAVGTAVGKNPLAIVIPCHRVVNKNKKIINYFYGPEIKNKLLQLEKI